MQLCVDKYITNNIEIQYISPLSPPGQLGLNLSVARSDGWSSDGTYCGVAIEMGSGSRYHSGVRNRARRR